MKWIGQHIWDLTSRFRNDIYFEGLAETAETRGLVVDANGKVSINPLSGDEHATHIYENVRNDEGATIPIGTPVYSKGEIGGSERILVGIADASDPAKMPAIGITNTELTTTGDTKDGLVTLVGVYNTNLTGFTGLSVNDIVYVNSGGGLTTSKPAGTNLIQNVGIILKTNGTIIQGLQVTCIGRTNDIPNSLQLRKADGTNAGLISMTGNDMVLSNATGDVLIGSTTYQVGGDQDIFIGDGINSVDLVFEQSGAIKGYDSSVNLTFGGGGGTITFADKVNFVGGGIENEFQFNNLTADGNFELSPITTTTSGGVLNGGFLNPAAEAKQVHMPQVLNDLAGFNHWGTVTVTGLYKTRTGSPGSYAYSNPVLPGDFANAFDGTSSTAGSWYSDNGASGTVQGEGVITLEWTNEALYGLWFGLVFGSDSFVPSRIKMEAYQTDVGWRTFADLTGVSSADIGNIILRQIDGNSGTGQATSKLRFTLGSSISGSYLYFRIHTIYLANYAQGNNNLSGLGTDQTRGYHYLERYRPNYAWGHFNPGQTTTYNLGGSSYRWATGYFNSLDVTQSINIAGSISAGSSVGNLNVSAGIGQDLEYGSTAVTTLRFDSDRWRLYAGGTSAELMTLKENGNVGIGIDNPTSKLDVNGTIKSRTGSLLIEDTDSNDIHAQINSNSTEGVLRLRNGSNWGLIARGVTNSPRIGAYHNGDLRIYGFGSSDGADHANDDELARFDFANERLIVNGQISVGGNITTSSNSYIVSSRKFTARDANGTGLFADDGASGLSIADDGDATFTGNLTINSTYPRIFLTDSNHNDDWSIINNDGKFGVYNDTDTSYALSINGTNNVGIGTTSPHNKAHITSSGNQDGLLLDLSTGSSGDYTGVYFKVDNNTTNAYKKGGLVWERTGSYNEGRFHFLLNNEDNTNNVDLTDSKLTILSTGNVGIGTTSPSYKLTIDGDLKLGDNDVIRIGDDSFGDLKIYHDGSNSYVSNFTGDLYIQNAADDGNIIFRSDDNSGGVTEYFRLNGADKRVKVQDGVRFVIGTGSDLQLYHNSTNSFIENTNGDLTISNLAENKDIIFKSDDGSGGEETYFFLDGSNGLTTFPDNKKLGFGNASDLRIQHDGSDSYISQVGTGDLYIQNAVDDKDIIFQSDDGSGGVATYFRLDGSQSAIVVDKQMNFNNNLKFNDGNRLYVGTHQDLQIYHDGSNSYIVDAGTGDLLNYFSNEWKVIKYGSSETCIEATSDGSVDLYYDNSKKFETTSTGIAVSGKINATDINFSGLPTSSAGLSAGDVWDDNGTLKIVR